MSPKSAFLNLSDLYLNVPFEEKDHAKACGAKWNDEKRLWYAPTGNDPLQFRRWWAFLGPAYDDKEELKTRGVKWTPEVRKWLVPSNLDFDDFAKWWPADLQQYVLHDRFVCHEQMVESGQSTVYLAWDLIENEWVAIKLFHQSIGSDPSSATAFDRECTALLDLDGHKNILALLDWGEHERSGRKFTVTPWIDHTLADFLENPEELYRSLYRSVETKCEMAIEEDEFVKSLKDLEEDDQWFDTYDECLGPVLDGLVYAFDRNIVHRDLKPANVFWMLDVITFENSDEIKLEPVIKIGDFGAAKSLSSTTESKATVVNLYTEPWTPHPSEKEKLFQPTWDVFAWGVMAVALITDVLPKTYEDTVRLLDREFKEKVGENLHTLIAKSISPHAEDRPQNVKILQKEILKLNKKRRKALGKSE